MAFHQDHPPNKKLKTLRLHVSQALPHACVKAPPKPTSKNNDNRGACALCSPSHKCQKTHKWCNSCEVFLCDAPMIDGMMTCFDIWHRANNLEAARTHYIECRIRSRSNELLPPQPPPQPPAQPAGQPAAQESNDDSSTAGEEDEVDDSSSDDGGEDGVRVASL